MTDQSTFADLDYQHKKRRTRREAFLEGMDSLTPWQRLEKRIGAPTTSGPSGDAGPIPCR